MSNWRQRVERERDFHNQRVGDASASESMAMRGWWESPGGQVRFRRRVNMFRQALPKSRVSPRVLVIGCGDGLWIEEFTRFAMITAIDVSDKMVEDLKQRTFTSTTVIEVQDCHQLHYQDETFDAVFANSVLHHLDLQIALPELARVLTTEGQLIAAEPNRNNPLVRFMYRSQKSRQKFDLTHDEEAFTKSQILTHLSLFFQNSEVRYFDFWHPVLGSNENRKYLSKSLQALEKVPFIRAVAGSLWITASKKSRGQ